MNISASLNLNASGFLASFRAVSGRFQTMAHATTAVTGIFLGLRGALQTVANVASGARESLDLGGKLTDLSENTGASVADLVLLRQDADHIFGFHPPRDFQCHQLAAELVADRQPFEPPSVIGLIKHEVVAPHVVDTLGAQSLCAILAVAEPLPLGAGAAAL